MRFIEGTEIKADQQFRYGGQKFKATSTQPGVQGSLKVIATTETADDVWMGELVFYPGQQVTLIGEMEIDTTHLASRITRQELQGFFDGAYAKEIVEGMTRIEVLGITRDPNPETIDYRIQQVHRRTLGTEMGWVQVGRGEFGQIVLLESASDWDNEE